MGETQNQPFQLRELDERLGLGALIDQNIMDDRRGKNTQWPLADLLGQSIYSRLAFGKSDQSRSKNKDRDRRAGATVVFQVGARTKGPWASPLRWRKGIDPLFVPLQCNC